MGNPSVVFATPYFGGAAPLQDVPPDLRAFYSADRSRLKHADAVAFHIPDFTYARFGDTPKYKGQLWVAWSMESNANYPLQADPAFLRHFDLRISYERSADIWLPYLPALEAWHDAQRSPRPPGHSDAPVVMFQSANDNRSGRFEFAAELMRHIRVDSYGKTLHNCDLAETDDGRATKMRVIGRYAFCLAFENSIAPDYVTEKLFQPLLAGTVPVYLGAPNAHEFAPPHSFIRAGDYGGPRGLAAYLHHLTAHPDEYAAYLAWRAQPLPEPLRALVLRSREQNVWRDLVERLAASGTKSQVEKLPRLPFGYRAALRSRLWKLSTRSPRRTTASF